MSNVWGNLLAGAGQPITLSIKDIHAIPKKFQDSLKTLRILEEFVAPDWFCETCLDYHEYDHFHEQLYQRCPEDLMGERVLVSNKDAKQWRWSWEQFKQTLCETNHLIPFPPEKNGRVFIIGAGGKTLYIFVCADTAETLIAMAERFHLQYPQYHLVLITTGACVVNHSQQCALTGLDTHHIPFQDLIENSYILPSVEQSEDNQVEAVLILEEKTRTIILNEQSIPLPKDYLYRTALILIRAKGEVVSEVQFTNEYYANNTTVRSESAVDLTKYCAELNKVVKDKTGISEKKKYVFINKRNQGYCLNPLYLPAKIRA